MYCVTVSSVGDWKILITVPRDTDTRTPISRATLPSGVRPGLPMPWQHLFLMYFLIHEAPCPPLLTSTKISHQLPSAPTVLFQGCLPREFVKQTYTYLNLPWSINWYQAPNPVFRCHTNGVIWYVSFFCLTTVTQHCVCEIHPPGRVYLGFTVCSCWAVFHCMNIPQCAYPLVLWMNTLVVSNLGLFMNTVCITVCVYIYIYM